MLDPRGHRPAGQGQGLHHAYPRGASEAEPLCSPPSPPASCSSALPGARGEAPGWAFPCCVGVRPRWPGCRGQRAKGKRQTASGRRLARLSLLSLTRRWEGAHPILQMKTPSSRGKSSRDRARWDLRRDSRGGGQEEARPRAHRRTSALTERTSFACRGEQTQCPRPRTEGRPASGAAHSPGPQTVDLIPVFSSTGTRSEERRVGKECLRLCRSRWSPYH